MINALISAFELANTEVLHVAMPDAHIKDISSALLRKWNCQKSDILGKSLMKFGTGLVSARQVQSSDGSPEIEISYAPPLGSHVKSLFRSQPWGEGAENSMLLIGQHGSLEQTIASENNEKRLQLALRSGGYALWDFNCQTGETYNSPEMKDIFGFDVNEINYQSFNALIHPEDANQSIDQKIREAPFGKDVFQTRYRVKTAAGKYAWIETVAGLLRDPATGKPAKVVGLCRNIDDLMVTLDRLKNSELMLKRTQAVSHLGSFKLRIESGVSRLTAEMAALLGMANAMIHPNLETFIKMIEPGDKEKFVEGLELAKLGRQIKNLEIAVKKKSGELEYFQVSMDPERGSNGEIESIFGACQCVTERKALENKFQQAQKMEAVGQLTGGIAHDFNNLLMVVMGNLQLVEQLVKHDDRATKRIRAAIEASEKGSDLTRRMLAFSRQQTLQNKELAVSQLLLNMRDMLQQAVSATIDLKILPTDDLWPIKADQTMLETAILNLTINARDAMGPKGGMLMIECANRTLDETFAKINEDVTPGDYVEIAVTDTGSGIAPENIEKVFQPFFTTKGPEAGSGLGLSMIYGFCKQSGGHVKIYSEVGHGTSVKLYLPRLKSKATIDVIQKPAELQQHVARELGAIQEEAAAAPLRRMKVLVVEDNNSVRE
ncbi:MAG: PAS domain-containing protein, partial [Alphaproteobacteria bacterium]|nr:PAS domain-containing protein [Alphaproteobacteria bacterium]